MFANRVLNSTNLLYWASELVGKGILRKGFARFLWNLDGEGTEKSDDQYNMEPAKFEEILKEIGVATPLPVTHVETSAEESGTKNVPVARETTAPGDGAVDGTDLLVVMRLPLEVDAETRQTLSSVRQSALMPGDGSGGTAKLRAVVEFDHAGAPHGLPERVMALSHKIGTFSPRARWRHGGLFVLHNDGDSSGASSMILEYDKKLKTFSIEALGHTAPYFRAVQFVISALFHVASDFPGTNWTGWMECEMNHDGEKMYHLAPSEEKEVNELVCRNGSVVRGRLHDDRVSQHELSWYLLNPCCW